VEHHAELRAAQSKAIFDFLFQENDPDDKNEGSAHFQSILHSYIIEILLFWCVLRKQ
jgi:hypothetical protein